MLQRLKKTLVVSTERPSRHDHFDSLPVRRRPNIDQGGGVEAVAADEPASRQRQPAEHTVSVAANERTVLGALMAETGDGAKTTVVMHKVGSTHGTVTPPSLGSPEGGPAADVGIRVDAEEAATHAAEATTAALQAAEAVASAMTPSGRRASTGSQSPETAGGTVTAPMEAADRVQLAQDLQLLVLRFAAGADEHLAAPSALLEQLCKQVHAHCGTEGLQDGQSYPPVTTMAPAPAHTLSAAPPLRQRLPSRAALLPSLSLPRILAAPPPGEWGEGELWSRVVYRSSSPDWRPTGRHVLLLGGVVRAGECATHMCAEQSDCTIVVLCHVPSRGSARSGRCDRTVPWAVHEPCMPSRVPSMNPALPSSTSLAATHRTADLVYGSSALGRCWPARRRGSPSSTALSSVSTTSPSPASAARERCDGRTYPMHSTRMLFLTHGASTLAQVLIFSPAVDSRGVQTLEELASSRQTADIQTVLTALRVRCSAPRSLAR